MVRSKKKTGPTPVEATKHNDERTHIPTAEMRDFVAVDEKKLKTTLYPRDTSKDPQLVWTGKDEQDAEPLAVPVLPIYIQEKIEPKVLVENLRKTADQPPPELTLFEDFDAVEGLEAVEFYEHGNNWSNRMILGDSLQVMASLADKENLKGQVQMIYIDPPYGIKFGSNWQVSTRKRDVRDGRDVTRQPEQVKAFRDTWELGVHSYLAHLRDRFIVARELLTETGSVFVQIGDENVHLVRALLDEVFGAENLVAQIQLRKTGGKGAKHLDTVADFLCWYGKDQSNLKYRQLFRPRPLDMVKRGYTWIERPDGAVDRVKKDTAEVSGDRRLQSSILVSQSGGETTRFEFEFQGQLYRPSTNAFWKTNEAGMKRLAMANRLMGVGNTLAYKRYAEDFPFVALNNWWEDTIESTYAVRKIFVVQTAAKVVQRCILMTTDPGDLVLDPTCGSGTTAYVAEQWGRRWITMDTSRVALAIARTRLMSARFPYYLLADSESGRAKEAELAGFPPADGPVGGDVKRGFVYGRVPHITLRSITTNSDIRDGMTREEVDGAIHRQVDREVLVDQPYEDKRCVRVSGRFTVESLSPHRSLDAGAQGETSTLGHDYETTILDNLRKAGVQNTYAGERITFDRLDVFPGTWINAEGDYTDADSTPRRIAVSLGPEHGTVSPDQVKDAAKEALQGVGFDLLIVCGFAFDALTGETAREFEPSSEGFEAAAEEHKLGKLRVLLARMNPDLTMGDKLLKKTGSGNLFTVFGEPDVEIIESEDGVTIEVHGVDVYDPTTGVVRSSTTDDIAAWFVDTHYNAESFFVRHAYFTGGQKPFDDLARALKADINPEAWEELYTTKSRPFPNPETGKIAVKVINHYGDEVTKVYEIPYNA